jgi:hypothetical protein
MNCFQELLSNDREVASRLPMYNERVERGARSAPRQVMAQHHSSRGELRPRPGSDLKPRF